MKHKLMALRGLVTWTKKYSYGAHWVGYLNIDPDFTVELEQYNNEWNLAIKKEYDAYYVDYPRTKRDAAYAIEGWIDRGMRMEY
mgnify:CR=1 FL=1